MQSSGARYPASTVLGHYPLGFRQNGEDAQAVARGANAVSGNERRSEAGPLNAATALWSSDAVIVA